MMRGAVARLDNEEVMIVEEWLGGKDETRDRERPQLTLSLITKQLNPSTLHRLTLSVSV